MNQFVVPQFLEVEDKIFGPITTRQFVILLVAGLFIFVAYKLADMALFIFFALLIGGSACILAFAKINGQSFHYFLLNVVVTLKRPSRRIWNKIYAKSELNALRQPLAAEEEEAPRAPKAEHHHIRSLSLMVNTGGYYKGE